MGHQSTASIEAVLSRLETLSGDLVAAVAGIGPETVDGLLTETLRRIGETLRADQVIFESVAAGSAGHSLRRAWSRAAAPAAGEPTLIVQVSVPSGSLQVLSVAGGVEACSCSPSVKDRLRSVTGLLAIALHSCQQSRELAQLRAELSAERVAATPLDDNAEPCDFEDIIGDGPAFRLALARVQEVAPTTASVVLIGETGTGKELFARAVHDHSPRRHRPFVAVNCAALPATLIESELFGHERGAFTGAVTARQGRFEVAHQGTLFLDEIGDLPAEVQAKLLRVLQEGQFERVGSSQLRKVDVRVVVATHHDLEQAVKEGRFRADLFYRLNVYPISLPPLRDRPEDLPRLVWFFVNRRQRALNRKFTNIPASVFATLAQHSWPGNVRELANVIERAMIHSTGATLRLDEIQPLPGPASPREARGRTLEDMERLHIEDALRKARWRINGPGNAAEALGLHPNTLRFRMKKLGIRRPPAPAVVGSFTRRSA